MITSKENFIILIKYKEVEIRINNELLILILGITNEESIFMRLNINNSICYENLFRFIDNDVEDDFDFILNKITNFNYSFEYIDKDKKLLFILYSESPYKQNNTLSLYLKNNSNKIVIKNEEIMKSIYYFNVKNNACINESSDNINLNDKCIEDDGFKDLSNIKLNILILDLRDNKIRNISPLNSDNFKYLRKLYLSNNEIADLKCLKNLKLEFLLELKLNHNKIVDISPLENVKFKQLQILDLSKNKISNIDNL